MAQSPAVVLADMAGKTNRYTNKKPRSRKHEINLFGRGIIVERTYAIKGQGLALISALSGGKGVLSSKPSRWFWPAANSQWEQAKQKMQALVYKTNEMVNKSIGT